MMKTHLFIKVNSLLLFLFIFNSLSGQSTLVGWSMLGQNNYGDTILSPSFTNDSIVASNLTKNFLTSTSALSNAWGGRNFTANTSEGGPYYFEFSISPVDTLYFTLNELTLNYRRSGTGPNAALLLYSIDSDTFRTVTHLFFEETVATELPPVTLPPHLFSNIDEMVTFRVVPYGATSTTGTWYIPHIEEAAFDLSLKGEVSSELQQDTTISMPCTPVANLRSEVSRPTTTTFSWEYDNDLSQTFIVEYKKATEVLWGRIPLVYEEILMYSDTTASNYTYTLENLDQLTDYEIKVLVTCEGYDYESELLEVVTTELVLNYDEILVGWSMLEQNNYGDSVLPPTHVNDSVAAASLTKNFNTSASGLSDAWGGRNFVANTSDGGPYYAQFSLSPIDTMALNIREIRMNYRRSGTGPSEALIQYSFDDNSYETISTILFPSTTSATAESVVLPQTSFSNIQSVVYFRIIPYGASSATGTWYIPHLNNTDFDLSVIGEVTNRTNVDTTTIIPCRSVNDLQVAGVGRDFAILEWSYPTDLEAQFLLKYKGENEPNVNEIDITYLLSEFQQGDGMSNFIYTQYELASLTNYLLWLVVVCDGDEYESDKIEFVTDAPPSSITENESESHNFSVFINDNTLYVNNHNNVRVKELILYNLQGQVQLRRLNLSDSWTSPFNFAKGVYIMQLITESKKVEVKIVNN